MTRLTLFLDALLWGCSMDDGMIPPRRRRFRYAPYAAVNFMMVMMAATCATIAFTVAGRPAIGWALVVVGSLNLAVAIWALFQ